MSTSVTGTQHPTASAASAMDTSTNPTTATSNDTITSDDFMTLLVAEMQNQDPTAPSDPTQYIQQLVGVNSLQQLIGINTGIGELTSSLDIPPTT
ncbi:flagellar hook capping FlgD N-terminal domain-containing protein [Terriglobus saanensis]|uniref:Basal-body rod modification protein FlgD n=1 Tax=Terriglobus saanensis (strain ATCC BAA-1853 / DSM 23119 / SP1PR4) TaxID=401053 RepID=E8V4Z6_TERSS|nr:flagellar hook capping FlgD N-terminal domain-containing protein [Terriglobus saanensis]ADV82624.1 flagellar hook capping protein [Terriglobus saanensis SP1PR4]